MPVSLGSRVKDSISGFTGIATGKAQYLHASDQVLVSAETCDRGKEPASCWLDERRLTEVVDPAS